MKRIDFAIVFYLFQLITQFAVSCLFQINFGFVLRFIFFILFWLSDSKLHNIL